VIDSNDVLQYIINHHPRNKKNYARPGHYEAIAQLDKTDIEAGEPLVIRINFSGYGQIEDSKLYFTTSSYIFNVDSSFIQHSIGKDGDSMIYWGAVKSGLTSENSILLDFQGGVKGKNWEAFTNFIDISTDSNDLAIFPEKGTYNPPVLVYLKTKEKSKPGTYTLDLIHTYFNGKVWVTDSKVLTFKVKNWVERNINIITVLGLLM
jgi:hypothetical protein